MPPRSPRCTRAPNTFRPNHNSHILEHLEELHYALSEDVIAAEQEFYIACAANMLARWRSVVKELTTVGREVEEISLRDRSALAEWMSATKNEYERRKIKLEENNRWWDAELVLAFGE